LPHGTMEAQGAARSRSPHPHAHDAGRLVKRRRKNHALKRTDFRSTQGRERRGNFRREKGSGTVRQRGGGLKGGRREEGSPLFAGRERKKPSSPESSGKRANFLGFEGRATRRTGGATISRCSKGATRKGRRKERPRTGSFANQRLEERQSHPRRGHPLPEKELYFLQSYLSGWLPDG